MRRHFIILLLLLPGCAFWRSGGDIRLESMTSPSVLKASLTTRVYRSIDENTADFYLTDLHPSDLLPGADLRGVAGQFLHVHMFLDPKAGRTPIDETACTAIIRHLVVADGEIGLYGGGGFMFTSGGSGDSTFGGDIRNASLQLLNYTDDFHDWLGPSYFSGSIGAELNPEAADRMAAGLSALLQRLPAR